MTDLFSALPPQAPPPAPAPDAVAVALRVLYVDHGTAPAGRILDRWRATWERWQAAGGPPHWRPVYRRVVPPRPAK